MVDTNLNWLLRASCVALVCLTSVSCSTFRPLKKDLKPDLSAAVEQINLQEQPAGQGSLTESGSSPHLNGDPSSHHENRLRPLDSNQNKHQEEADPVLGKPQLNRATIIQPKLEKPDFQQNRQPKITNASVRKMLNRSEVGSLQQSSNSQSPATAAFASASTKFNKAVLTVNFKADAKPGSIEVTRVGSAKKVSEATKSGTTVYPIQLELVPGRNVFKVQWIETGKPAVSIGEATITYDRPTISFTINVENGKGLVDDSDQKRTNDVRPTFQFTGTNIPDAGQVTFINSSNGEKGQADLNDDSNPASLNIPLRPGINRLRFQWNAKASDDSSPVVHQVVELDTTGPILQFAELIEDPATGNYLQMRFADDDLPAELNKASFIVQRQDKGSNFNELFNVQGTPKVNGRFVKAWLPKLPAGSYQLSLHRGKTSEGTAEPLKDDLGNLAEIKVATDKKDGIAQTWQFSVLPGRKFGQHVAFPQFTPPKYEKPPEKGFNPGDFVETRVMRLYYFRDAHRVAQIINRNIRSLNIAAVEQAQRRAQGARDEANEFTDERRKKEREAVRAAQSARSAENKLNETRRTLNELQRDQFRMDSNKLDLDSLETQITANPNDVELKKDKAKLERENFRLKQKIANTPSQDSLRRQIIDLEKNVADLRRVAVTTNENAIQSQSREDRARERQFRLEVSAAKEDPGTYVAGDIKSVDPVTQCSLSVIGEGLIQIRGPIKGINKVRIMINQIDSPLGQVKIGINTVQVNGERAKRMERVIGRIEGDMGLARFLTSQSLQLLRKSIQEAAAQIAAANESGEHYQVDRDRKYLYGFFGRDFIDELYEMDSEFLRSENKILSLHSMDTISLNRALFILALAKNDVRQQILARFQELVYTELPNAEWDYRRSSELVPHKTRRFLPKFDKKKLECNSLQNTRRNARQRYHFRNLRGFFETGLWQADTMNPTQREFIRLAQIFKSQMIAEVELKQRVIERGLIEDPSSSEDQINEILLKVHKDQALPLVETAYSQLIKVERDVQKSSKLMSNIIKKTFDTSQAVGSIENEFKRLLQADDLADAVNKYLGGDASTKKRVDDFIGDVKQRMSVIKNASWLDSVAKSKIEKWTQVRSTSQFLANYNRFLDEMERISKNWENIRAPLRAYITKAQDLYESDEAVDKERSKLIDLLKKNNSEDSRKLVQLIESVFDARILASRAEAQIKRAEYLTNRTRAKLDHRKLLNFLIDEQEEKYIELVEGTKAHIATVDQYLKRLAIALEDDFKVQFYDPAWVRIRCAATAYDVSLGQLERTTILTNNRAFAKVSPQATMEFDLPKRKIAIVEALDGAKALAQDYGALLNDPTFLAAFEMMGGTKQASTVKKMVPGLPTSTDQHEMGQVTPSGPLTDSALQRLVPNPEIYKFETGTGYEIRPVIQPDGDSVVYDFNYMYTTNVREPVAADEKHLGRIKRHYVDTQVQISSFEWREISRYHVALKASRTAKGVPLLEDIPVAGALFRPAPSDESSIQQNIIFGSSTVYPTLFDLMGLRWAPQIVDLDHINLQNTEHVVRGRFDNIRGYVFDEASRRVDEFLHLRRLTPEHYRPDLYHSRFQTSPYHPNGYRYYGEKVKDPTYREFRRRDRRPPEMQSPPYDVYRRRPMRVDPGQVIPNSGSQYGQPLGNTYPPVHQRYGTYQQHGSGSGYSSSPMVRDSNSQRNQQLRPRQDQFRRNQIVVPNNSSRPEEVYPRPNYRTNGQNNSQYVPRQQYTLPNPTNNRLRKK